MKRLDWTLWGVIAVIAGGAVAVQQRWVRIHDFVDALVFASILFGLCAALLFIWGLRRAMRDAEFE